MIRLRFTTRLLYRGGCCAVALVIVLTACRGNLSEPASAGTIPDPNSAEKVHAALLAALEANDREQVIALTVDDQQAARADTWLRMVQSYMQSTATDGPYATGGKLQRVEIDRIDERGAARQGRSRWIYPQKIVCHVADLTQTTRGWRVTSFHLTTDECPREH